MFCADHSAARGRMGTRKLIVFGRRSALGNAPSFELFERVRVDKACEGRPARAIGDYEITAGAMPNGVKVHQLR